MNQGRMRSPFEIARLCQSMEERVRQPMDDAKAQIEEAKYAYMARKVFGVVHAPSAKEIEALKSPRPPATPRPSTPRTPHLDTPRGQSRQSQSNRRHGSTKDGNENKPGFFEDANFSNLAHKISTVKQLKKLVKKPHGNVPRNEMVVKEPVEAGKIRSKDFEANQLYDWTRRHLVLLSELRRDLTYVLHAAQFRPPPTTCSLSCTVDVKASLVRSRDAVVGQPRYLIEFDFRAPKAHKFEKILMASEGKQTFSIGLRPNVTRDKFVWDFFESNYWLESVLKETSEIVDLYSYTADLKKLNEVFRILIARCTEVSSDLGELSARLWCGYTVIMERLLNTHQRQLDKVCEGFEASLEKAKERHVADQHNNQRVKLDNDRMERKMGMMERQLQEALTTLKEYEDLDKQRVREFIQKTSQEDPVKPLLGRCAKFMGEFEEHFKKFPNLDEFDGVELARRAQSFGMNTDPNEKSTQTDFGDVDVDDGDMDQKATTKKKKTHSSSKPKTPRRNDEFVNRLYQPKKHEDNEDVAPAPIKVKVSKKPWKNWKLPSLYPTIFGKFSNDPSIFPLKTLLKTIGGIYTEKIKADEIDDENNHQRQTMPEFTHDYMLMTYGLKSLCDKHLYNFVANVRHYLDHPRVKLIGRFLELVDDVLPLAAVNVCLKALRFVHSKTHTATCYPDEEDGTPWVPMELGCQCFGLAVRDFFNGETIEADLIEQLPRNSIGFINLDTVITILIDRWEQWYSGTEMTQRLQELFKEADVNHDGVLTYDEFKSMIEKVEDTKRTERELLRLFQGSLAPGSDQMDVDAFVRLSLSHNLGWKAAPRPKSPKSPKKKKGK